MTDLTFAPFTIIGVLSALIIFDLIKGIWSIWTTLELIGLLFFVGLYLYAAYGPTGPPMTEEELKEKYPEIYEKWYKKEDSESCEKGDSNE